MQLRPTLVAVAACATVLSGCAASTAAQPAPSRTTGGEDRMSMLADSGLVQTDHHHVWLGDPNLDWPEYTFDHVVLEPHSPTGLYLETGVHTGLIGLAIKVHDAEPSLDTERWPDQQTVTLFLASTEFLAIPLAGGGEEVGATLPKPGRYSVRAAWTGRYDDQEVEDGEERYLIDVWPAG